MKTKHRLPEEVYRKLPEELYDGVFFVNDAKKILFWNKRAAEISGHTKKEVIGKPCYNDIVRYSDRRDKIMCPVKICPAVVSMRNNKPYSYRAYLARKDQTTIPVDIHTKPIKHRNKVIGAVEIFRDASIYDRVEKQKNKMKMMSLIDFVTSLPNRRYVEKRVRIELSRFKRCGSSLHVALIDIDHFKNINDTYGHGVGDLVLRKMAYLLENNLRATDFIGRYGGEEFLLILSDTTRQSAGVVLEKFRRLVEMHKYPKGKMAITISIGATKALKKDTLETVLRRADKALYKAKNSGRNRVCFVG